MRQPRTPTLADVARAAGVSVATASRALSGRGPVSASARADVLRAAHTLSYAPHPLAVSLARGEGHRIVVGIVAPSARILTDQYATRLVAAAAREADRHDVGVSTRWLRPGERAALDALAGDRTVRGVLLVNHDEALVAALPAGLRGRVTVVGPGFGRVPSHDVDTAAATAAAVRRLTATGRRRIAMLTGPAWASSLRRPVDAYRACVRAHGLPCRTAAGGLTVAGGTAGARRVLRRWPDTDAIVAITDAVAIGALRVLADEGVRVPDDVAVTGFDDIPLAALGRPALTTATHPVERIAAGAVRTLMAGADPGDRVLHRSVPVRRESA
ncbi:LacI family DNA-binding transcriptional regulator [Micromonospora coxensis]|uniref:Transcriptional regulator, LacI family n=1 Tax=Micromonospora coxensis TaxID=356852 RepID=A0A1C5JW87_9ACTN|nr:LacI family DNA-binding transcriptional regulator [Micromonospora coxensis]SCG74509.1 transcriptional regulator, LacI family [Micromonospora coxensis]